MNFFYPNLGLSLAHSFDDAPALQPFTVTHSAPARVNRHLSWGLGRIGVPSLWKLGLTGRGIVVGHLDTGIDGTHPALGPAIAAFAVFDAAGVIDPHAAPFDPIGHGTQTAGIIAARATPEWKVGVAPGARLASALVIDGGDAAPVRVLAGIDWAVGQGVRVLNLSLGTTNPAAAFGPVIDRVRALGILPIIAAGNDGRNISRAPANYENAVSVGAINPLGRVEKTSSSQRMPRPHDPRVPDVVLPGASIVTTDLHGLYRRVGGTSIAAPHLAGLAALLWEARPEASVDEMESALFLSCRLPKNAPSFRANRGVPNAIRALHLLETGEAAQRIFAHPSLARSHDGRRAVNGL